MSQIDFSKARDLPTLAAQEDPAHPALSDHAIQLKQACSRRISQELDLHTLINVQTAAVVGRLSQEETRALAEGQRWIEEMLRTARHAVAEGTDPDWPAAPANLSVLRATY